MEKNFRDIKEIYETSNQMEVNSFLSKGWELLDIYQKITAGFQMQQILPAYILGRPASITLKSSEVKREMEEDARKILETCQCKE